MISKFFKRRLFRFFLAGLAALVLLGLTSLFFPQQVLTVDSGDVKADVLIVLGGGSHERPVRTAELFKQGAAPLVICSGLGDCDSNRRELIRMGVPAAAVQTESKSRNTRANAEFSVAMLRAQHIQSAIIVTSWYHSRRALHCFEHFAPDMKFYSRPSYFGFQRADWKRKGVSAFIKAEYVKLLGYWVCYGICPL